MSFDEHCAQGIEPNYKRIKNCWQFIDVVTALNTKIIKSAEIAQLLIKTEQLLKKRPFV
jgi:fumarate hydratase class II